MSTDIELLRTENTILWKKLAALEEAYRIREFDLQRLVEERDATQKRCDQAYANVSTLFKELQDISLMTKLGGEVDDYSEITSAVREIVEERDSLREQVRENQE